MKILNLVFILMVFISIQSIKAQEITMFPGFWSLKYYQDANRISKKQVETLMLKDTEANHLWKKSKKHLTYRWIAFGAEVGFLIWQLNNASNNKSQTIPLIGVLGSSGVAIGSSLSSNNLKKKAILKYNQNAGMGSLNLGPTYNGLVAVLSF